jgi:hypothetical protein
VFLRTQNMVQRAVGPARYSAERGEAFCMNNGAAFHRLAAAGAELAF